MINVKNTVAVYEVNGEETKSDDAVSVEVRSHWLRNSMVVLSVNGTVVTVSASDLRLAVDNATNTGR